MDPGLPKLKKLRDRLAAEIPLDPGLVAPNAVLEGMLRLRPESQEELLEVPGMRRWQAGLLGARLLEELHRL